ncbi:hypothetical protein M407DRAFT_26122 [Tulasnella calospora MUT 4182]|uniref:Aldehyde dehydrogenase n=1 Tax=Tulasnella calospora MUT 4182 TaxID=1051891 RepID=A0A0C3LT05_9AGAM|nr:hypothetical protein M407DRAFT_26122 [Tulasnella calospora MUT 4182]
MSSSTGTTSILQYTPIDEIPKIREHLKATYNSGRLRPLEYRKQQLLRLIHLVEDNYARFEEPFKADLGRHTLEVTAGELNGIVMELMYLHDNFETWAQPQKPGFNLKFWAFGPVIKRVSKGVVLVVGPFNFPLLLTLSFLGAAIATGNACVIKMSELTPNVSAALTELLPKYLDQDLFRIVNGGIPETTAVLQLQWDHIVFTGSPSVARIVAAAAAKHLTPTTLELGGQCPVFCDPKMDMYLTARRLLWSKSLNAGQTCTVVNHIFVPYEAQDALAKAFVQVYNEFFPEGPEKAPISTLATDAAFKRIKELLEKTKGEVVCGGHELFGPILPIVPVKDFQDAIDWTNSHSHPLAVYAFTDDPNFKEYVFNNTHSGQFVVNDTNIQATIPTLPFGGVGESGYGMVKGQYIFDTLSHLRATCESPRFLDMIMGWRFPPYTDAKIKQAAALKPRVPPLNPGWGSTLRGWMPF